MEVKIKPLPQTTYGLLEDIQRVGCFFRSAQAIAELEANKTLSIFHINSMWIWAKKQGIIDPHNMMKASAPIANKTLEVLGVKNKRFYEVATSKNKKIIFYKSVSTTFRVPKYFIRKIKSQFTNGTHFLVVNKDGKTIFDPDTSVIDKGEIYTIVYNVT